QTIKKDKVSDRLLIEIKNYPQEHHRISILFRDQFDVRELDRSLYERKADLRQRAYEVITKLQQHATQSQANVMQLLRQEANVEQDNIHSFWISNLIFASAKYDVVAKLSQLPEVAWLDLNGILESSNVERVPAPPTAPVEPQGIEPGLAAINAPALWKMGYTGYGCVTFANDTGVDPTHPSISSKWRGCYAPASESWFQYNSSNTNPFDCGSHGTHTLGTMVGLDRTTNDTIGVAFNALWVGAPILCGLGTEDNVAAFEWALDPDNNPETIVDMPDVINNSWFDPNVQNECNNVYNKVLDALEAAGVAVIFSAGNAGPEPSTITPPHNINTDELNSFTVGALNGNSSALNIADFSSRGPAKCTNENEAIYIKPE
ncbi:MAG: S8 family serine peptidase, partial [Bacteroidota bacterium]